MMNKALEIIEARWLFDVDADQIEVTVHPQSIVHSMVLWSDGSVISQMGIPDMRVPIQYALTHPTRLEATVKTWSPEAFNGLTFFKPDTERFTSLKLGFFAAREGGTYGAVLNAANEEAVAAFFAKKISFQDIFDHVAQVIERHQFIKTPTLEEILDSDRWAREEFARC
jgi:1-deoxy-D-xylulose-5-phosphate reductoisomerase